MKLVLAMKHSNDLDNMAMSQSIQNKKFTLCYLKCLVLRTSSRGMDHFSCVHSTTKRYFVDNSECTATEVGNMIVGIFLENGNNLRCL